MFSFFKKKKGPEPQIIPTYHVADLSFLGGDMHSHLVPGIDDGSQSLEDSVHFIRSLREMGIRDFITTPHIHGEMYDNDTVKVQRTFEPLREYLKLHHPDMRIQTSAEYFLDSYFLSDVLPKGLMPFGDNQVLVEVSMAGWNRQFNEIIFAVQANGYKPILAHPERYIYETDIQVFENLKNKGVSLQLNLLSIIGYYGRSIKINADKMLEAGLYDYCGTDLHHQRHLDRIRMLPTEHQETLWRLSEYGFRNRELFRHL
ncbi:tyrosine-protein phosphatase [Rurimicrobium arvi]|uniref:protein-tyrosine-phosphatase n=1 Tax=Rurimicrobium arvi TaxID=2049916 RepID=A0ABP8MDB3_9BACT